MTWILAFLKRCSPTLWLKRSSTVQYTFSVLFLFAALASMASVIGSKESSIRLVTSSPTVVAGEQFSIDVFAFAHTPVNAVDIAVSFPADQVEILGIDRGESVITLWTKDPYVEGTAVILRGGTYQKGFVGEHKIATINARAITTGAATFGVGTVQLLAGDGKGTAVKAKTSDADVTTNIVTQTEKDSSVKDTTLAGDGAVVIATDINGDGKITLTDVSSFMASWSQGNKRYDFNNDGDMTFRDFSIILYDYFAQ
jgi:hypothetical protein